MERMQHVRQTRDDVLNTNELMQNRRIGMNRSNLQMCMAYHTEI
jgi:hypothetical protein